VLKTRAKSMGELDFSKLLGFKRFGRYAHNEDQLARALGAVCNKLGELAKPQVDTEAIPQAVEMSTD